MIRRQLLFLIVRPLDFGFFFFFIKFFFLSSVLDRFEFFSWKLRKMIFLDVDALDSCALS